MYMYKLVPNTNTFFITDRLKQTNLNFYIIAILDLYKN